MKEGRVVEWLKSEGDTIESGEPIATIESDKADMDLEAFEDGILAKIIVQDGEVAKVGSPIALFAESADEVDQVIAQGANGANADSPAPKGAADPPAAPAPTEAQPPECDFESVYMPALSSTMTEGKVVSWEIEVGEAIAAGEPMLTVESDKADMEVEVRRTV